MFILCQNCQPKAPLQVFTHNSGAGVGVFKKSHSFQATCHFRLWVEQHVADFVVGSLNLETFLLEQAPNSKSRLRHLTQDHKTPHYDQLTGELWRDMDTTLLSFWTLIGYSWQNVLLLLVHVTAQIWFYLSQKEPTCQWQIDRWHFKSCSIWWVTSLWLQQTKIVKVCILWFYVSN